MTWILKKRPLKWKKTNYFSEIEPENKALLGLLRSNRHSWRTLEFHCWWFGRFTDFLWGRLLNGQCPKGFPNSFNWVGLSKLTLRDYCRLIFLTFACILEKAAQEPVIEVKLPEIGAPLKNINVFSNESDPVLLPDSQYPEWIWQARGPCRAAERAKGIFEETEAVSQTLAKIIRNQNRERIRQRNETLKGSN